MNRKVRSAKYLYTLSRKTEIKLEHPDYTSVQISQLLDTEWSNLPSQSKLPYEHESEKERLKIRNKGDSVDTVGIAEFMSTLKTERKKKKVEIDPEFKEDDILQIVNHKRNWRKTWTKKEQKLSKRPEMRETGYRMN